jgi:hypothetical protein
MDQDTGGKLAILGSRIYLLADAFPEMETNADYQAMMYHLNKLSYLMINGKERHRYHADCHTEISHLKQSLKESEAKGQAVYEQLQETVRALEAIVMHSLHQLPTQTYVGDLARKALGKVKK